MKAQSFFALVVGALLLAPKLHAQEAAIPSPASPAPPSPPPSASPPQPAPAAPPIAEPAPIAEPDRGGVGESCRARLDCDEGLACIKNVCCFPGEGAACVAHADCASPLLCKGGRCAAPGALPTPTEKSVSAPPDHPFTIDVDEVVYESAGQTTVLNNYSQPALDVTAPSSTFASTILGLRYTAPRLRLEAEIPFATWWGAGGNVSAAFGNLALGAYYTVDGASMHLQVGAILSLPTSPAQESVVSESIGSSVISFYAGPTPLQEVLFSRGYDRSWLWISHHAFTPFAPSVRIFSDEHLAFQHATEVVVAPTIGSDSGASPAGLAMQVSEEVGAHVSLFRAGARAEIVALATSGSPFAYVTAMPFAGIGSKHGFVDVGALFNLTDPLGYSLGTSGPNWGLRVRGGLRF